MHILDVHTFTHILDSAFMHILDADIVMLTETWREKERERWFSEDGHMFCGAGGSRGEKGTAIMIHRRWRSHFPQFQAVHKRICLVDLDIHGSKLRLLAVYMPHGGLPDEDVEDIYGQLDKVLDAAKKAKRTCILVGDWNAVVGSFRDGDQDEIVGLYGLGRGNRRGKLLVNWASTHKLTIANTMFTKPFDEQ